MIDRISIGLLGFSYSDANNNNEYNKSIYFLYSGLSSIIKIICDSFLKNSVEESFSILTPIRKNCPVKYNLTKKEEIPYILTTESIVVNNRRKSYILPRAVNTILSNPGIQKSPSNFVTPKHNVNKSSVKDHFDFYQVFQNHYSSKNDESEIHSFYLNTPSEIPSLTGEEFKKNFTNYLNAKKNLVKVVEEVNSKNSYSLNSASLIDKSNNFNNSNTSINGKYNDSNMIFNFETIIRNKNKNRSKKKQKNSLTTSTSDNKKTNFNIFNAKKRNMSLNFRNSINDNKLKMRKTMIYQKYNNYLSDAIFKKIKNEKDDLYEKKNIKKTK